MATEAQTAANRANAQKSTGPKTPEGKARVSRNALRHGLRARLIVDNPAHRGDGSRFRALLDDLVAELSPVGVLEEFAVETIACCIWRLKYVIHEELYSTEIDNLANNPLGEFQQWDREEAIRAGQDPEPLPGPQALAGNQRMALLVRYEANLYRQYYRARRELESLQAVRLAQPTPEAGSSAAATAPPCVPRTSSTPSASSSVALPAGGVPGASLGLFPFAETFFCQTKPSLSARAGLFDAALSTILSGARPSALSRAAVYRDCHA